ncbi:hypothetical protein [Microbacterium album]|uniref:Uncharacterized protein n=1 Tax=Microbacterium album TaxID=2053191 RepID=A0A917MMM9_9MICO|nr:hypothetical protein [Microbacterium album]GGH48998.1 hypothetical protein GCM10010921_26880 [Microbacterium album]
MGVDSDRTDDELLALLRRMWESRDAPPADLTERMIAAVAVDDVSREYALLTEVSEGRAAVRSEQERLTLQFSDDAISVLLHVAATESGARRVDGWCEPPLLAARLAQDAREWAAEVGDAGRFAFEDVTPGLSAVRLIVQAGGELKEFITPQFEV